MSQIYEHLPPVIKEIVELKAICEAEQPELELLAQDSSQYLNNQFITTADEDGLSRWERTYGLAPKAADTLEDRRFALKTLFIDQRPTTFSFLKRQLTQLCGADGYQLAEDYANYRLKVRLALAAKSAFDVVSQLVRQVAPANLIIDIDLLYNRHSQFKGWTHAQMSAYMHQQIRSDYFGN